MIAHFQKGIVKKMVAGYWTLEREYKHDFDWMCLPSILNSANLDIRPDNLVVMKC